MATGSCTFFDRFILDLGDKVHLLSSDNINMGIVTNTTVPTAATADPRWGAGGTTNFSSNEVTPGGNYSTGGPELTAVITDPWTAVTGGAKLDLDNVSIAANASNPTGAYWGIVYNNTATGKQCIGFIELGTAVDLTGGLTVTWAAGGFGDIT